MSFSAFSLDRPQQLLGVFDITAGRDELGVGKPEATHTPIVELSHFRHHFLDRIHSHRLTFDNGVYAVATVVGTAALGLHANVEIATIEIPFSWGQIDSM
jgi:hypothetical protein